MTYRFEEPRSEYIKQNDIVEHIAICARTCYDSIGTENQKLFNTLEKRSHASMLRHASRYYKMPKIERWFEFLKVFKYCPYVEINETDDCFYMSTNMQFYKEVLSKLLPETELKKIEITEDKVPYEYRRFTFRIFTSIAIAKELNRVSPNNIAERSTRYVDYCRAKYNAMPIMKPHWFKGDNSPKESAYLGALENAAVYYGVLRDRGLPPEDARGIIPLDAMSEVVYTYTYREWEFIFAKRVRNATGKAHPNAIQICSIVENILDSLKELNGRE
jgi:hypothetical protein|nr:MAG TPA: Thymidylate synthase complementing protein [Bacteriophage sp.]